ncbi:MAG: sodium:alanine symporter family protein [Acidobacteriota bacterium]
MHTIDRILSVAVGYAWGPPLLVLLVGGGSALLLYSRFLPFFRLRETLDILRGRYERAGAPGEISQFQAVSTALAATVGMGNIGGVAIAITQGGPGALFWMWVAAVVGMATKFFSCSLSILFRGPDSLGRLQGGPMYYIEHGLGKSYRPLAILFSACGMIGCLAMFQSNQVAEILDSGYGIARTWTGMASFLVVAVVILGGVTRIARVASMLVPAMCVLYLGCAVYIAFANLHQVPEVFFQIFHDAFTGTAAAGGAAGVGFFTVVQTGIKRAAFSNEAGIGTSPMAHGASRNDEPVREGLVSMIEPVVDTIIVCSLTAFIILSSGHWQSAKGVQGVTLTTSVFESTMGGSGKLLLTIIVILFGVSTMFGYSYYGRKCFAYLFGAEHSRYYDWFYLGSLWVGAVWSAGMVVNLIDTCFALMAFPNMVALILLAPKVMRETRRYFLERRT